MNSIVIYGSHFGNTKKVADAITAELAKHGTAQSIAADEAPARLPVGTDLLVVGGPTEAFHMTAPVAAFLNRLQAETVDGVPTAVFDTRIRPRWWLLGYAGSGIAKKLRSLGAAVIVPPEGFLVEGQIDEPKGKYPSLVAGELERAATWAAELAAVVESSSPRTTVRVQ